MNPKILLPLLLLAAGAAAQPPLPADLDENGRIDRAEWREGAAARFRAADRNADGYLDASEQKQLMPRRFVMRLDRGEGSGDRPAPPPGKIHGDVLHGPSPPKDTNGDGLLDPAEVQAQADQAFARMDADGNGWLDAEELMPPLPVF